MFALLAAAFTIANVVGRIVLTSYRDIGVMKAIGFTPGQVTATMLAEILVPVAIRSVVGVVLGTIASQPTVMRTTQSFGLPAVLHLLAPSRRRGAGDRHPRRAAPRSGRRSGPAD